ncbi:hypothetical protein [[Mycoplasma] gypis]|uniref:hypothetical protein n=1 Tax=[Mycoplasma] gypis TaxID=92404 RepID=UPI001967997E|nr:hypothetical protein [[Mycoplasma] gypis]MBN0919240.1 hypothetical protein [[Mycoplasma] gypis]
MFLEDKYRIKAWDDVIYDSYNDPEKSKYKLIYKDKFWNPIINNAFKDYKLTKMDLDSLKNILFDIDGTPFIDYYINNHWLSGIYLNTKNSNNRNNVYEYRYEVQMMADDFLERANKEIDKWLNRNLVDNNVAKKEFEGYEDGDFTYRDWWINQLPFEKFGKYNSLIQKGIQDIKEKIKKENTEFYKGDQTGNIDNIYEYNWTALKQKVDLYKTYFSNDIQKSFNYYIKPVFSYGSFDEGTKNNNSVRLQSIFKKYMPKFANQINLLDTKYNFFMDWFSYNNRNILELFNQTEEVLKLEPNIAKMTKLIRNENESKIDFLKRGLTQLEKIERELQYYDKLADIFGQTQEILIHLIKATEGQAVYNLAKKMKDEAKTDEQREAWQKVFDKYNELFSQPKYQINESKVHKNAQNKVYWSSPEQWVKENKDTLPIKTLFRNGALNLSRFSLDKEDYTKWSPDAFSRYVEDYPSYVDFEVTKPDNPDQKINLIDEALQKMFKPATLISPHTLLSDKAVYDRLDWYAKGFKIDDRINGKPTNNWTIDQVDFDSTYDHTEVGFIEFSKIAISKDVKNNTLELTYKLKTVAKDKVYEKTYTKTYTNFRQIPKAEEVKEPVSPTTENPQADKEAKIVNELDSYASRFNLTDLINSKPTNQMFISEVNAQSVFDHENSSDINFVTKNVAVNAADNTVKLVYVLTKDNVSKEYTKTYSNFKKKIAWTAINTDTTIINTQGVNNNLTELSRKIDEVKTINSKPTTEYTLEEVTQNDTFDHPEVPSDVKYEVVSLVKNPEQNNLVLTYKLTKKGVEKTFAKVYDNFKVIKKEPVVVVQQHKKHEWIWYLVMSLLSLGVVLLIALIAKKRHIENN